MKTRSCIRAILLAAFALALPQLIASEYSYRIWRAEDGLPRNRIQAIEQTPDGYLWIATSGGLARFDGVRFVVFDSSNTPALHDESILSLLPARDGSLWAGTEGGGLVHYRNGAFTSFGAAEGLTNGFVRALAEDDAGNLWVGTDRGFFRMVNRRFVRLDHGTPQSPFASAVQIVTDKQQRVWVGTQAGLLTVSGDMIVPATCHGERMTAAVKGLYRSSDGTAFTIDAEDPVRLRRPKIGPWHLGQVVVERHLPAPHLRGRLRTLQQPLASPQRPLDGFRLCRVGDHRHEPADPSVVVPVRHV